LAIVVGVGNRFRGDDGLGPEVAARVERLGLPGVAVVVEEDPLSLVDHFAADDTVIVVDAMRPRTQPGRVQISAVDGPLPRWQTTSSHGLGVVEAVELARALERLPDKLTLVGVEAATLSPGSSLSAAVLRRLDDAVNAVVELVTGGELALGGS
jgi:hydrogenase maturation protease